MATQTGDKEEAVCNSRLMGGLFQESTTVTYHCVKLGTTCYVRANSTKPSQTICCCLVSAVTLISCWLHTVSIQDEVIVYLAPHRYKGVVWNICNPSVWIIKQKKLFYCTTSTAPAFIWPQPAQQLTQKSYDVSSCLFLYCEDKC